MYIHKKFWPRFGGWIACSGALGLVIWFGALPDPLLVIWDANGKTAEYANIVQMLGYYCLIGAALGTIHAIAERITRPNEDFGVDLELRPTLNALQQKYRSERGKPGKPPVLDQKEPEAPKQPCAIPSAEPRTPAKRSA